MARRRLALAAGALSVALGALTAWAWTERTTERPDAVPDAAAENLPAPPAVDGSALFHAKGCATCHNGPDSAATVGIAPSLAAVRDWDASRRRGLPLEEYLRQSILEPAAYVSRAFSPTGPLTAMPPIAVSPEELDALVAYLLDG